MWPGIGRKLTVPKENLFVQTIATRTQPLLDKIRSPVPS